MPSAISAGNLTRARYLALARSGSPCHAVKLREGGFEALVMTMVALMMMMTQPQRLSGDQCCDSMRFVLLQSLEDNPVVRLLSTIYYLLAADSTQPGAAQKLRKSSSL